MLKPDDEDAETPARRINRIDLTTTRAIPEGENRPSTISVRIGSYRCRFYNKHTNTGRGQKRAI
jgi:hypothetical protein